MEAMACGCPVVASTIPALVERCGDAALYCEASNPQQLADKIVELLSNSDLHSEFSRRGRDRARRFTWRKAAEKTLDAIEAISRNGQ